MAVAFSYNGAVLMTASWSQGGVSFRLDALYNLGLRSVADDGGSEKNRRLPGRE